jgi:hypothetical protein
MKDQHMKRKYHLDGFKQKDKYQETMFRKHVTTCSEDNENRPTYELTTEYANVFIKYKQHTTPPERKEVTHFQHCGLNDETWEEEREFDHDRECNEGCQTDNKNHKKVNDYDKYNETYSEDRGHFSRAERENIHDRHRTDSGCHEGRCGDLRVQTKGIMEKEEDYIGRTLILDTRSRTHPLQYLKDRTVNFISNDCVLKEDYEKVIKANILEYLENKRRLNRHKHTA